MRLRSVTISRYKNLRDFSLDFEGEEFIDIFVGKNGCGKSNFLEALIEIFDHLYTFGASNPGPDFDYRISWETEGAPTELGWEDGQLSINGRARKQIGRTPLPANVIVYYSGQNETVAELIERYQASYRRKVRKANVAELPRFIGIGPDYKALLLALMLMMPEDTRARQYLCTKLGIEGVGSTTWLKLRRPGKGIVHQSLRHDPIDPDQRFWGVKGVALRFLDQLTDCISGGFAPGSLYIRETDTYRLSIDVAKFRETFADTPADEVFCQFNALRALGMIEDVSIPVRLGGAVEVTSRAFSDGQFQSIYLFAISELFKDRDCLTLLDEPDAFLHPEWQYDFLSQVLQISEEAAQSNHILMSSHSASTIAAKVDTRLRVFEMTGQSVIPAQKEKSEIIDSLSAGLISFSEQEARLSIEQVLGTSTKPVLFTEGISDVQIIVTAWGKLFPDDECPFETVQAFDRGYLRNLMVRSEIFQNHPGRQFFALFDFDEAYADWKQIGCNLNRALHDGYACRNNNKPAYGLLLPIPASLSVRNQAWNTNGNCDWAEKSCVPVELLFCDEPALSGYFQVDQNHPAGWVHFVGDKVVFAETIIPSLPAGSFECFRPMFEFIKAEINGPTSGVDP